MAALSLPLLLLLSSPRSALPVFARGEDTTSHAASAYRIPGLVGFRGVTQAFDQSSHSQPWAAAQRQLGFTERRPRIKSDEMADAEASAESVSSILPPALISLDFVPDFSFRTRVASLHPAPDPATANTTVLSVFAWGFGQVEPPQLGVGDWSTPCEFTRNSTGKYWAGVYPNTYNLRKGVQLGDDTILVTHLFVCHGGSFPWRETGEGPGPYPKAPGRRDPNQTSTVEVEVTLEGKTLTLGATLEWGGTI